MCSFRHFFKFTNNSVRIKVPQIQNSNKTIFLYKFHNISMGFIIRKINHLAFHTMMMIGTFFQKFTRFKAQSQININFCVFFSIVHYLCRRTNSFRLKNSFLYEGYCFKCVEHMSLFIATFVPNHI